MKMYPVLLLLAITYGSNGLEVSFKQTKTLWMDSANFKFFIFIFIVLKEQLAFNFKLYNTKKVLL